MRAVIIASLWLGLVQGIVLGQGLDPDIALEAPAELAQQARQLGDPVRGAILFHQPYLACTKCHVAGVAVERRSLGPDLAQPIAVTERSGLMKTNYSAYLVESLLAPSNVVRKGFETQTLVLDDGRTMNVIVDEDRKDRLVVREVTQFEKQVVIEKQHIDERVPAKVSLMPPGLLNQLASKQQFFDLVAYVIAISEGGPQRALELKPHPALYAVAPLPEYEADLDHAKLIGSWNSDSFKRGEAIYLRVCANCHGTHDRAGSLPLSLRFGEGKFKSGNDPLAMYQTLTRGFGLMVAQSWMVPKQKYDVIYYIREAYLKERNPTQFARVDAAYLGRLPKGSSVGPEPANLEHWVAMDYGPSLINTYEFPPLARTNEQGAAAPGSPLLNFAYKGIAVRLDTGVGGVSRGQQWMVFDHDTLRVAGAWSRGAHKDGFIDWQGIHFDGRHNAHPHVVGALSFSNPVGPGWANPQTGSFEDQRVRGRDGRLYGPLPRDWGRFRGLYHHGQDTVISYSVGDTSILELPGFVATTGAVATPIMTRTFNIGPRSKELVLQVATHAFSDAHLKLEGQTAVLGAAVTEASSEAASPTNRPLKFDGQTFVEVERGDDFDLTQKDFSVTARLRTTSGGTVFCQTQPGANWIPNGKSLFVRGGQLCFDIGWVGAVTSRKKVNDGKWHDVALTWEKASARARLFIDGKLDGEGVLRPNAPLPGSIVRVGFSAQDFPTPATYFSGDIARVSFVQALLSTEEVAAKSISAERQKTVVGAWDFTTNEKGPIAGDDVVDVSGQKHVARVQRGSGGSAAVDRVQLVAGVEPASFKADWVTVDGQLRLRIPSGDAPLKFTLWQTTRTPNAASKTELPEIKEPARDLAALTKGGSPRWPQRITTDVALGDSNQPFAVDVLTPPTSNPWLAQLRLTGFDFFEDGDRVAVCAWDGDVWLVSGLKTLAEKPQLVWQRIASGLFQPLGLKRVDGKIFVTCRDQLVVLHDLNGDLETDFYECLNNDHQVTEHFHEFAMGLQTDAAGNFYYAKSARHALKALVPHHGTLLRVSKDGSKTDILANGFRAANGVCLNPDGTFIVTDQEGHWNPKNRINWVTVDPQGPPRFYGNMFGYHDVTDSADSAMQPPLCWITNAFDRSPAELLWVPKDRWGPLQGSLLNLSYGYGKIFVVPHEQLGSTGVRQGGLCELPLPNFPTGIMRGRFHPEDGHLYACGMFAWAGNATQPGGFYRVRYTGKPVHLPLDLKARKSGVSIRFSDELDPVAAADVSRWSVKTWSLKRSANYGSKHYDEKTLSLSKVVVSADGRSVHLQLPDIQPTWGMEIKYAIKTKLGAALDGTVHNTIHELRPE